jgi:protein-S-isoprenylcysteine O-methyltransferase Ste14
MKSGLQAARASIVVLVLFGLMLFLPAWTFHYWQAWVFLVVFTLITSIGSVYLVLKSPAALQRRRRAGPAAETRIVQKVIIIVAFLSWPAVLIFSAFDYRFGWSPVPVAVSLIGDTLIAIGLVIATLVIIQNSYASANITVESGQKVVSTGLYGLVRHPMYVGTLIMMVGLPLSLDSRWGLVTLVPAVIALIFRVLDEEKMLRRDLDGYGEYTTKIRYRLVPYVW